jgi:hypothetical protein
MLKNGFRKFVAAAVLAMVFVSFSHACGDYQVEFQPKVLEQAIKIEQRGILKQKENGYLYVEVSNDFISKILPFIDAPGRIVPPRHYVSKKGIGAHISVMYENEQIESEIWEIKEIGKEYSFEVMELRTIKLNKDGRVKKLWLLAVDAPDLEDLRMRYGLTSKLKGHDFHITIGSQIPGPISYVVNEEDDAA